MLGSMKLEKLKKFGAGESVTDLLRESKAGVEFLKITNHNSTTYRKERIQIFEITKVQKNVFPFRSVISIVEGTNPQDST